MRHSDYLLPNIATDYGAAALRETIRFLDKQADDADAHPEYTAKALEDSIIAYLQMHPHIAEMRRKLIRSQYPDHVFSWFQDVYSSLKPWLDEIRV